jgi:hypothetical protein
VDERERNEVAHTAVITDDVGEPPPLTDRARPSRRSRGSGTGVPLPYVPRPHAFWPRTRYQYPREADVGGHACIEDIVVVVTSLARHDAPENAPEDLSGPSVPVSSS